MIVDVQKVQGELEGQFLADQADIEKAALELYKSTPEQARDYLTEYSEKQGDKVHTRWRQLGEQLLVKYIDGNVRDEKGKVNHPQVSGLLVPAHRRRTPVRASSCRHEPKPVAKPEPKPEVKPAQKPEPKPTVAPAP